MIQYLENIDFFTEPADARVIPVNCVGALGKGLAEAWRLYPGTDLLELQYYYSACATYNLEPGEILVFRSGIILAATKDDWRRPSRIDWIEQICASLASHNTELYRKVFNIPAPSTVLLPKLGCGNGKLDWETEVMPIYDKYFTRSELTYKVSLR